MRNIYFLSEYDWEFGELVSEGPVNYKIKTPRAELSVKKAKCAFPKEEVCIVWEMWKGVNGRGGYRVERKLYSTHRVPAELVARQSVGAGRVNETHLGQLQL